MSDLFALRLRELRQAAGLTQAELSEKSGIPRAAIANYEQGRREPSWSTVLKLAEALAVTCLAFTDPPAKAAPRRRGRPRKDD